ncbi:conserved hypothetical protein [Coccidioides posadasii str. Silveira]|uniref:Uncharacterized protein n=1 Tax=Coccidioides posadasii (strain RMSCC 757 / Silveira) TaxID=443226 RepID=E9D756_COCPS|nr:conserved hypothetical protein [Coccidioides posadasii str. Silveira]
MAHCKYITVNINNIKLVLGICVKIRLNYFSLINVLDHLTPATIICHLHAVPTSPTTTATTPSPSPPPTIIFLPPPSTIRVSTHQITDIRAPVEFTKPVLEEQKKKKKKKKRRKRRRRSKRRRKREKKNNNNNKDDNNNN